MPTFQLSETLRSTLWNKPARRWFLDRQVDFWLRELNGTWSLSESRARVLEVIDETDDVKTFVLAPPRGWSGHQAGQYLPVDVEVDGVRMRRCYSISSSPQAKRLAITVKRVPQGRVSSALHDQVRPGHVLQVGKAAGDFTLRSPSSSKLLLVSGGSGITPLMSILRALSLRDAVDDVLFVHCARSRKDVIFRSELEGLAALHCGLRLAFLFDDDATIQGGPIDEAKLRALVPDLAQRGAMLCGPAGMMNVVRKVFSDAGIEDRLQEERFAAPRPVVAAQRGAPTEVHLTQSRRTLSLAGNGTLLEQLERAGERPAHGCRMGICNTCRCKKKSGVVEDLATGVVSSEPDEEIRLCTSVPRSDLALAL